MSTDKEIQIKKALATMFIMFDKEMPKEVFDVYTSSLMKFELLEVQKAIRKLVETETFYPKLGTIMKYLNPSDGELSLVAGDQFNNWIRCSRRFSGTHEQDRITKYLDKIYLPRFKECTEEGLTFLKKEFIKDYIASHALGDKLPEPDHMLSTGRDLGDLTKTLTRGAGDE